MVQPRSFRLRLLARNHESVLRRGRELFELQSMFPMSDCNDPAKRSRMPIVRAYCQEFAMRFGYLKWMGRFWTESAAATGNSSIQNGLESSLWQAGNLGKDLATGTWKSILRQAGLDE